MDDLASRLQAVDERIAAAARGAGRDPAEITRIVVTKFHPSSLIEQLRELGVADVGENRQQELSAKVAEVREPAALTWHFVGQAQSNKAKALRSLASRVPLVVHSVDRPRIADALAGDDEITLDVLVQIDLSGEPGRGGVAPDDLGHLVDHVLTRPGLRLRGIMAVAPLGEEPAAAFDRLAQSAARVREIAPEATWMSAGMTGDFAEAIAAGATHLRIGTAITGNRPARG